mmetsp:Transcript_20346/g.49876  ORF Transcript_20346/g.49876 Transcript_20346/m.49876 type:complete len:444 (-) Transcript_20346:82-1413(-)
MNVPTECYDDDSHPSTRKESNASKKKVRFFFNTDTNMDEESSRISSASSKFSLKAMRDEVSSKLKFPSNNERDAPPTILEETGFELLPNCDDDGNSSITIARAEKDYLNRTPPLRTHKAKIKRMFKRKNKMDVISTIYERDEDDDASTLSDDVSYLTLESEEACRKMPARSIRRYDTQYQQKNIGSKDIDDNQWKELFVATQKMVYYFVLGQQLEAEAKQEVRPVSFKPKWQVQEEPGEPQKHSERWGDVARRQSYKTIKKLKMKAKELPMKARALPVPKPILKVQKMIPRRESFFRDRPRPSEIEFVVPALFEDKYGIPGESNSLDGEVAMALETFRVHAKRLGVNEMELMDVVQHDERSLRTGFIADDADGSTVITYGTTYHSHVGEMEEDERTVYTRATLGTYAPTVADTEYTSDTMRESEENLFMVSLVDVFDYFFVPA